MAKLCFDKRRPDILLQLLDGWSPRRTVFIGYVGSAIASLSMCGFWKATLHMEAVYAGEIASAGSLLQRVAPWTLTFLLLSAAQGGQYLAASRLLTYFKPLNEDLEDVKLIQKKVSEKLYPRFDMYPSEMDLNLALYAHFAALQRYTFSNTYEYQLFRTLRLPQTSYVLRKFKFRLSNIYINATSNSATPVVDKEFEDYSIPKLVDEIVAILQFMINKNYSVHPKNLLFEFSSISERVTTRTEEEISLIHESSAKIRQLVHQLKISEDIKFNSFEVLFEELPTTVNVAIPEEHQIDNLTKEGNDITNVVTEELNKKNARDRMKNDPFYNVVNINDCPLMEQVDTRFTQFMANRMKTILNSQPGLAVLFNYTSLPPSVPLKLNPMPDRSSAI